ncbi:MAG: hypothetical protein ACR2J8_14970, partial [Thermomicrobiales bacterium]
HSTPVTAEPAGIIFVLHARLITDTHADSRGGPPECRSSPAFLLVNPAEPERRDLLYASISTAPDAGRDKEQ